MVAQTGACGRTHDPRVRTLRNFATVQNAAPGAEERCRRAQVGGNLHAIWGSGRSPRSGGVRRFAKANSDGATSQGVRRWGKGNELEVVKRE